MPNTGLRMEIGVPFSSKFQSQLSWQFSNTKPAEFELMAVLIGGGNMMNEDEMQMMQCMSSSAGRKQLVIQKPLSYGIKATIEAEIARDDPNQSGVGLTLQKDFQNSHFNYQFQGMHMFSYMQSITESLHAGWHMVYVVSSFKVRLIFYLDSTLRAHAYGQDVVRCEVESQQQHNSAGHFQHNAPTGAHPPRYRAKALEAHDAFR